MAWAEALLRWTGQIGHAVTPCQHRSDGWSELGVRLLKPLDVPEEETGGEAGGRRGTEVGASLWHMRVEQKGR